MSVALKSSSLNLHKSPMLNLRNSPPLPATIAFRCVLPKHRHIRDAQQLLDEMPEEIMSAIPPFTPSLALRTAEKCNTCY